MAVDDRPELDALSVLRTLSSDEPAPPRAQERVWGRLATTLRLAPPSSPLEPQPGSAPTGGTAERLSNLPWRSLAGKVSLIAIGGVLGAGAHAALAPERVTLVYVDRPESSAASPSRLAAPPPPSPTMRGDSKTQDVPAPAAPAKRAQPADVAAKALGPAIENTLGRERALLDGARRGLASGEGAASLEKLREHQRLFPRGRLSEERDALLVNAWVLIGAHEDARRARARFHRAYPRSFLAPSVDAAVQAIPE